ncbi:MAG: pantoate--beta-alanine ligase [Phycisphaera sp.]|nr:MAG: pantoate--beta-alanine ligase [Phycisphaera sp.]
MRIIRSAGELADYQNEIGEYPGGVLVPTMGALHTGHESLIRQAAQEATRRGLAAGCVVTVFVNPTQFDEEHDFDRYPRVLDADAAMCEAAGASAVVSPSVEMVYPDGLGAPGPRVPDVAVDKGLEDEFRPGHFVGVTKVLVRLFELTKPAAAVFGEKDWQQYQLARALVQQEGLGIDIVPGPTVRDADGLAMSSRNRFLSEDQRAAATAIPRALRAASQAGTAGEAEAAMRGALAGLDIEYATVRRADTLERIDPRTRAGSAPLRALITCRLGQTRLLDNAAWPLPADSPLLGL